MLNCFTVDEAARELGCTARTVWRDLAVLQKANFPLYDDKDGRRVRYRLVDGFRAKLPAPFTLSEVVTLLMSRDLLALTSGSVLAPSVHAAFAKIRALLPDKAHRLLDEMRTVIGVRALGAKLLLGAADFLTPIHQALLDDRTSSTIEHDLMRLVREWMAGGRLPSGTSRGRPTLDERSDQRKGP